jgi:hypothetical protein
MTQETKAQKEPMTLGGLAAQVAELAGVDPHELPIGSVYYWAGPTGNMTLRVGADFPMRADTIVFGLFQSDTSVRCYTVATKPVEGDATFRRWTFTKSGQSYFVEVMSGETFTEIVADELATLKSGSPAGIAEEVEQIADWVRALPGPLSGAWLADEIERGAYADGAEEEPEVQGNGQPGAATPGAAPQGTPS